MAIVQYNIY